MARKARLIATWPSFKNKMAAISHLMANRVTVLKKSYICLIIAPRGLQCENLLEVMA